MKQNQNFVTQGNRFFRRIGLIIFAVALLALHAGNAGLRAQQRTAPVDTTLAEALQTMLDTGVSALNLMGASVAVIVPGEGEWSGVSGFSDPVAGDTIHPDMIFGAGSITKNMVAALTLKLAEEGLLNLDDSLGLWLPAFPHINGGITIRQLLNHTSGTYNFTDHPGYLDSMFADLSQVWTPEEVLATFVDAPNFPPGAGQMYSNTNYVLAGMIIRQASGTEVSAALRSRFLTPLALNHTFLEIEEQIQGDIAVGWRDLDGDGSLDGFLPSQVSAVWSSIWTAGAIFSTARDIARWGESLFGGQILTAASLNEMLDFQPGLNYGLGAFKVELQGRELWGHDGGGGGYNSLMLFDPQDGICISVMLNIDEDDLPVPGSNVILLDALLAVVIQYQINGVETVETSLPVNFELKQNYPNPFNPTTTIEYRLSKPADVSLKIFNLLGQEVRTLAEGRKAAGTHQAAWDGRNNLGIGVASGVYLYRLQVGQMVQTRKMIMLK